MDLIDIKECCRMIGGNRPVHPSTCYRLIQRKLWPKACHVGGSSRWIKAECESALAAMVESRHAG